MIIPCRNEAKYIGACLDSLIASDYPSQHLEVFVVDGMSEDGTRAILKGYVDRHSGIQVLDNVRRITPAALNIAIRAAQGDVILRMDAHVTYPPDYISRLVTRLEESGADNVGAVIVTLAASNGIVARAIAAALAHPFGVGNAYFRIGVAERRWVDTVPFGCYRREVFDRVGMFDEELVRNQDDELNHRILRKGGRILLVPEVASTYYARESLAQLWRMYFQYGYFKPLVVRKVGAVMTIRQLIPALFVSGVVLATLVAAWLPSARWLLGVGLSAYALVALIVSAGVARRQGVLVGLASLVVFPVLHAAYGVGYLLGIVDFLIRGKHGGTAVPLTR